MTAAHCTIRKRYSISHEFCRDRSRQKTANIPTENISQHLLRDKAQSYLCAAGPIHLSFCASGPRQLHESKNHNETQTSSPLAKLEIEVRNWLLWHASTWYLLLSKHAFVSNFWLFLILIAQILLSSIFLSSLLLFILYMLTPFTSAILLPAKYTRSN